MDELDLSHCPSLAAGRSYSLALLGQARTALAAASLNLDGVETIAVGGSLGRLEASRLSDIDCIVVVREALDPMRAGAVFERVRVALAELDLKPAKSWGIYSTPVSVPALLDPAALGSPTETPAIFGKRLQLLLDAKPVFQDEAFDALQDRVIKWYGTGFLDTAPDKSWTYLINDLMRYLHAYAAWQQYKVGRTLDDSWQLRQAKFRSTRLVTLAGLLVLLGESNAMSAKRAWLVERLSLTPLERLARVMNNYEPANYDRLLAACEKTHVLLNDRAFRDELVATGPESIESLCGETGEVFEQIRTASSEIMCLLTGFVLARQKQWDPRFFERLIF